MKQEMQWEIGDKVFIRTVTYHYVGEVRCLTTDSVWLRKASWVADSGRWNHALSTGSLDEVEPYPGEGIVEVKNGAIVDICEWNHDLPIEVK